MSQPRFPVRPCPVCKGGQSALLFRQSFEQLSGAQWLHGYDVVACRFCGTCFADDIPPQAVFNDYYRELSKYDYANSGGHEPPGTELRFRDVADVVQNLIPAPTSRILEIGCGSGQFLAELRRRGFPDVTGADPSPGCARVARDTYGIPVITGAISDLSATGNPYDFLILIGVMEHIRELDSALAQIHNLLSPAGRVYMESPDGSRLMARLDAPYQEFSVEHINFFSATSLTNLMQTRSFRKVVTDQVVRPQYEVTCPGFYGVYEKTPEAIPWERDTETEPGLRAYIRDCGTADEQIRVRIEEALPPGGRMIVWGVGTHTLRLLATGGLDPGRIALFVDSNPNYQNRMLQGIQVVAPGALTERPEPILISSRGYQREIQDQIRHGLGLANPVIVLYDS